jgi:tRNA (adenine22-N1)-methyltransferase
LSDDPIVLSARLQKLTEWIPSGARVADIGGDHAYLLIHQAKAGCLSHGIVGELNKGPFENARRTIRMAKVEKMVEVRLGDGLSVLKPDEVDVVVIAGMGGALIAQILNEGKEKLHGVKRLILQPNIGGHNVRRWLKENGFCLVDESLVEDAGILYEAMAAEPGEERIYHEMGGEFSESTLMEVGPLLFKKRHPLLKRKVMQEWESKQKVFRSLKNAKSETAVAKREQLAEQLKEWEKVKTCLFAEST